jgi:hypothetical protein
MKLTQIVSLGVREWIVTALGLVRMCSGGQVIFVEVFCSCKVGEIRPVESCEYALRGHYVPSGGEPGHSRSINAVPGPSMSLPERGRWGRLAFERGAKWHFRLVSWQD